MFDCNIWGLRQYQLNEKNEKRVAAKQYTDRLFSIKGLDLEINLYIFILLIVLFPDKIIVVPD